MNKENAFLILTQIEERIHSTVGDDQQRYDDIRLKGPGSDEEGTDSEHAPHQEIHQGDDQELDGQTGLLGLFLRLLGGTRCAGDSLSGSPHLGEDEGVADDHEDR